MSNLPDVNDALSPLPGSTPSETFSVLTSTQQARVISHCHRRNETSLPGVFAVGDIRGGNVKRVASTVGEGSIAISFVHQVLAE